MNKNNKIKQVSLTETRKIKRDNRTHNEKLIALRESFGKRKLLATQSGKVNDCSINKIAEDAMIDKLWLLGHRTSKKSPKINDAYKKIRDDVNLFRKSFSPEKNLSDEKIKINDLESQLAGLQASIEPTFIRIATLEKKIQKFTKVSNDLDVSTTHLIAKNIELEEQLDNLPNNTNIINPLSTKRIIISPDAYRKKGGKYVFGDKILEAKAWKNSLDELYKYLRRKLPMRLYILVGLPFSGKTTWAKSPDTHFETDRHPVIFDATNLTSIERIKLVQPLLQFSDLPIVCVYFDTDIELIRQSNLTSDGWERAKFTDSQLAKQFKKLEKPDPYTEKWIDNLRIVRRKY